MRIDDFNIITNLPYDDLPYTYRKSNNDLPIDNKIILFRNRDGNFYYNPQLAIGQALIYLDYFTKNKDKRSFNLLVLYSERIIKESKCIDSAIYLPYNFDYTLHDDNNNLMKAPWYSGMAQGMGLSFFSRRKEFTMSELLFESFKENIIAHIDENDFYWIDEYPFNPPTRVLNGFIYGIYGLYDYYRLFGNQECLEYLKAGITTVKNYAELYRVPGQVSIYCLAHRIPCDKIGAKYHNVHIGQFRMLYKMTGDKYFQEFADLLLGDFKPDGNIRNW